MESSSTSVDSSWLDDFVLSDPVPLWSPEARALFLRFLLTGFEPSASAAAAAPRVTAESLLARFADGSRPIDGGFSFIILDCFVVDDDEDKDKGTCVDIFYCSILSPIVLYHIVVRICQDVVSKINCIRDC